MKPNNRTNYPTIVFIMILISIILIMFICIIHTWKFVLNDKVLGVLYGVLSGLTVYTVTFSISNLFFRSQLDNTLTAIDQLCRCINIHHNDTAEIINITQRKYKTLIPYDRKSLLDTGFYENNYEHATSIKLSGVTLYDFTSYLCRQNTTERHLVNRLMTRSNMSMKVLLMHPDSPIVKILDEQETTVTCKNPVSTQIRRTISLIKNYSKSNTGKLAAGSKLEIGLTYDTMNSTLLYVKNIDTSSTDLMLMGILFGNKRNGPLYRIPNHPKLSLYSDCDSYFDYLFNRARDKIIFTWTDSGINYQPIDSIKYID